VRNKNFFVIFADFNEFVDFPAMYCSKRCLLADKDELHRDYCKSWMTHETQNDEFLRRMLLRSQKIFREESPKKQRHSVFDFDLSNCRNPYFCKNMMLATLGMQASGNNLKPKHQFSAQLSKGSQGKIVKRFAPLLDFSNSFIIWTEHELEGGFIIGGRDDGVCMNNIGLTLHPFSLLLNTSCYPNIHIMSFGEQGVSAWFVMHPIMAGEQLFVQYESDNDWWRRKKSERQKSWMETYGFMCDCKACKNNWKPNPELGLNVTETPTNREQSLKKYKQNCKFINENHKKGRPSGESS
jgi:hypothetical protein